MKAIREIAFAFALLSVCCESPAQPSSPAADYIEKVFAAADDALDDARSAPNGARQRVSETLAQLEAAITKYPDSAALHLMMGRALIVYDCALGSNNCSLRAKSHLTQAVALDPKLVRAHVLLAHDAMNSGCTPCAKPHTSAAEALQRSDPYVLEVNGRQYQFMGVPDAAEQFYLLAVKAFPSPKKRWQVYNWLSEIYKQRENYERAEWALQSALDAAPEGAWSNGNLGAFYVHARGQCDKAIPLLRKRLSIMNYGVARSALTLALYERWANAYLSKAEPETVSRYWNEAQADSSDTMSLFFDSASYVGTGRASQALFISGKVPKTALEQTWQQGRTPLLMAAINDNTELALFLIAHGANVNARDESGVFPAQAAAQYLNFRVMDALARKNANLGMVVQGYNETVLMRVARAGVSKPDRLKLAALLLDKGVPIDAKSARGMTALGVAIGANDLEMVKYLFSRGAKSGGEPAAGFSPPGPSASRAGSRGLPAGRGRRS